VKNQTRRTYQIIEETLIHRTSSKGQSLYAQKWNNRKIYRNPLSWEGIMNLTDIEDTSTVMIGSW